MARAGAGALAHEHWGLPEDALRARRRAARRSYAAAALVPLRRPIAPWVLQAAWSRAASLMRARRSRASASSPWRELLLFSSCAARAVLGLRRCCSVCSSLCSAHQPQGEKPRSRGGLRRENRSVYILQVASSGPTTSSVATLVLAKRSGGRPWTLSTRAASAAGGERALSVAACAVSLRGGLPTGKESAGGGRTARARAWVRLTHAAGYRSPQGSSMLYNACGC